MPLVRFRIIALSTAQFGRIVTSAHCVDHPIKDSYTQVLTTRSHCGNVRPTVRLRIVTFNYNKLKCKFRLYRFVFLAHKWDR